MQRTENDTVNAAGIYSLIHVNFVKLAQTVWFAAAFFALYININLLDACILHTKTHFHIMRIMCACLNIRSNKKASKRTNRALHGDGSNIFIFDKCSAFTMNVWLSLRFTFKICFVGNIKSKLIMQYEDMPRDMHCKYIQSVIHNSIFQINHLCWFVFKNFIATIWKTCLFIEGDLTIPKFEHSTSTPAASSLYCRWAIYFGNSNSICYINLRK